ncbi:MAG: hypothetical protein WC736_15775 [Gallionella sp.]
MIEAFHKQAALLGLKKMFEGKHFSICVVKEALVILGGHLSDKDEAAMRALHCIDFADMPPDLRKMLFTKVMEVLSGEPLFNTELLSAAMDGEHASGFRRLLQ